MSQHTSVGKEWEASGTLTLQVDLEDGNHCGKVLEAFEQVKYAPVI